MPLGMGGRHPFGQLFLSSAAIAAAGAWLFHYYHKNDAGWQLSVLDLLFAAWNSHCCHSGHSGFSGSYSKVFRHIFQHFYRAGRTGHGPLGSGAPFH